MIANGGEAEESEESLAVLLLAVPVGLGANGLMGDFVNDELFGLGGVERVGALTGNITFGVILWRENGVLYTMETYISMRGRKTIATAWGGRSMIMVYSRRETALLLDVVIIYSIHLLLVLESNMLHGVAVYVCVWWVVCRIRLCSVNAGQDEGATRARGSLEDIAPAKIASSKASNDDKKNEASDCNARDRCRIEGRLRAG